MAHMKSGTFESFQSMDDISVLMESGQAIPFIIVDLEVWKIWMST